MTGSNLSMTNTCHGDGTAVYVCQHFLDHIDKKMPGYEIQIFASGIFHNLQRCVQTVNGELSYLYISVYPL